MRSRWFDRCQPFARPKPKDRPRLERLEDRTVPTVVTFQQGVDNYASTQDTEIRSDSTTPAPDATTISVDMNDGGAMTHGLLRFDDIFGSGAGQIPLGSTINSAELRFVTDSETGGTISLHRMLVDWAEATATWGSFGGDGVQTNGTEAVATRDAFLGPISTGTTTFTVTASLQAWSGGATNRGWVLLNDATNGWDFFSSEGTMASDRPRLVVDFTAPSTSTLVAVNNSYTATAGTALTVNAANGVLPNDRVTLLSENFEGQTLRAFQSPTESGGDGTDWTDALPTGWTRDNTTTPAGNPVEFQGWNLLDIDSWIATEGNQERSQFTRGGVGTHNTVAVADPDAYDDGTSVTGCPEIGIVGIKEAAGGYIDS